MACRICKREVEADQTLCFYHLAATRSLKRSFDIWSKAYQGISWSEYLNRVKILEDTGRWIREVIDMEEQAFD